MILWRQHCDGGRRFRLPESVDKAHPRQPGNGLTDDRQGHRRGPIGDDFQRRQVKAVKIRIIQQLFQHRRHQHRPIDPPFLRQGQPLLRVKLPHYRQRPPPVDSRQSRLQAGDMVQRRRQQGGFRQVRVRRRYIGQQVRGKTVVAQLYALGPVGSAGSEHNHRSVRAIPLGEMPFLRRIFQQGIITALPGLGRTIQGNYCQIRRQRGIGQQRPIPFAQAQQLGLGDG